MSKHRTTDYVSSITIFAIVLLLVEVTFFNGGVIFSGLLSGVCIYFGRKKLPSIFGKILFWFGIVSLFFTVINMITFKFLLVAIILYFVIQFLQSKKRPVEINPTINKPSIVNERPLVTKHPFFQNVFFGQQHTPDHVYEWNDVNIQTGIGDTVIDLSNTVLPEGTSVIAIRNFIGSITVLIPYEIEVSVSHSSFYGSSTIFEFGEIKEWNKSLRFATPDYHDAKQKVTIVTSMIIGNIEVRRV